MVDRRRVIFANRQVYKRCGYINTYMKLYISLKVQALCVEVHTNVVNLLMLTPQAIRVESLPIGSGSLNSFT
jgi:hypothetical protein